MTATPNRVSDAGPDFGPEPDWMDRLYFAADEIEACRKLNDDDMSKELALRQRAIERAIDHLQTAYKSLPKPRTAAELAQGVI